MCKRCLQARIVNVPISPARPPVRKRNRFLTPISLNSQICDIFNDPDFWCKDRTRRKKIWISKGSNFVRYYICKICPGEKGPGNWKNVMKMAKTILEWTTFGERIGQRIMCVYGFPVTYFVVVVLLSIMWLAITSPNMLHPGIKHRTNEDDQFEIGCWRGLISLNFHLFSSRSSNMVTDQ